MRCHCHLEGQDLLKGVVDVGEVALGVPVRATLVTLAENLHQRDERFLVVVLETLDIEAGLSRQRADQSSAAAGPEGSVLSSASSTTGLQSSTVSRKALRLSTSSTLPPLTKKTA